MCKARRKKESPRIAAANGEWRRVCRIDLSLSFYVVGGVTSNFHGGKKKKGRRGTLSFFSNDELKSITINHFTFTQKRVIEFNTTTDMRIYVIRAHDEV